MQNNHVKKLRLNKKTIVVLNGLTRRLQTGISPASHERASCGAGDCTTVPPSLSGNPCPPRTKPGDPVPSELTNF